MIAYWPDKIKAHATSDHVSAFWDFLPTLCDIAGRKPPTGLDGISYLPALLGEAQPEHEFLYWEFHERGGKQAVRWKNWKGIRTAMTNNPTAEIELYDLSKDKGEVDNVAMQHPDIVDELVQIMKAEHQPSPNFKFKFEQK